MEKYKKLLTELNAGIWDYAELKFNEHQSAVLIEQVLEEQGFMLEKGLPVWKPRLLQPLVAAALLLGFWRNLMLCQG